MHVDAFGPQNASDSAGAEIRARYQEMLAGRNRRDADTLAAPFAQDAQVIGFDGSQMNGRTEIAAALRQIFADHVTAPYVSKIVSVRLLTPDVVLLRAIVGMVPPGQTDLNPAVNAHQSITAVKHDDMWRIELLQNTPAQFHGRPDLVQKMTDELRQLLK